MKGAFMSEDIKAAVNECINAREKAAAPLKFSAEALKQANDRTLAQFTANLEAAGGWKAAGPALLRASTLFGSTAKAIALFHNEHATEIGVDEMADARNLMEKQCKFGLAKRKGKHPTALRASDGLLCGG
jgi:hypothetical protein